MENQQGCSMPTISCAACNLMQERIRSITASPRRCLSYMSLHRRSFLVLCYWALSQTQTGARKHPKTTRQRSPRHWPKNKLAPAHMLGHFRLSVTTDDRSTFCDGLPTD